MPSEITQILSAIEAGDAGAAEALLPLVYGELRRLAEARLARETPGQTLQATALVHEAYLRLVGPTDGPEVLWDHRGHFFAAAAEAMRRILIDRPRAKGALKRGGGARRISLDSCLAAVDDASGSLLDLDDAIERLAALDPGKADLVKLRFFAGLTLKQAAAVLGIAPTTADRHWAFARAWLYNELGGPGPG